MYVFVCVCPYFLLNFIYFSIGEIQSVYSKQTGFIDESRKVLDDVKTELAEIEAVIYQFSEMRKIDPEKYKSAYLSLSLPGILEPLVLLDFLGVRLGEEGLVLSERRWHESLREFCVTADEQEIDGDATVLPKVVVKTFLPLLESLVSSHLDPLSASSSQCFHAMVLEILDYDPTPEELIPLFQSIVSEFITGFNDLCVPLVKLSSKHGKSSYK